MKEKNIYYTDGACSGNGEKDSTGGWAFVRVIFNEEKDMITLKHKTGCKRGTTNNEMELMAVARAIFDSYRLGNKQVTVYTDSSYVHGAISNGWLWRWSVNDWKTKSGNKVKNKKLWQKVHKLIYEEKMNVEVFLVKGHNGEVLNEYVDKLAVKARKKIE